MIDANASLRLSKADFEAREPDLWTGLLEQQRALKAAGVSTLVILAGPEGCGKGELADRLNQWLDTRGIETHAFWSDSDEERERPYHWRFWRRLPPRGSMAIMFGAWYWEPLYRRVHGKLTASEFAAEAHGIARFERMLRDDGMLIVKLWLHVDRRTHARRMGKRREVQRHVRGVAAEGRGAHQFATFIESADTLIDITGGDGSPWHLVDAGDARHRDIEAGERLLQSMRDYVEANSAGGDTSPAGNGSSATDEATADRLQQVDLGASLDKSRYKRALVRWQRRMEKLAWQAWDARLSTVAVFEGWDAAGKGGVIRRLLRPVDARLYRVATIGAPNDVERSHPYLWRFWNRLPRAGFMTVYDRSWYGRVLVERVEGLATPAEWMRSYDEINDFESQLAVHGIVVAKYWLHISDDEQLRRFHDRDQVPWKNHKLTDEDWRNREQRPAYIHAVEEMVARTDTPFAPWRLVAAEDKRHARVTVVRDLCRRLERALDESDRR